MGQVARTARQIVICTEDMDLYLLLDHIFQVEHFESRLATSSDELRQLFEETRPAVMLVDYRRQAGYSPVLQRPVSRDGGGHFVPVIALVEQRAERDYVSLIKSDIDEVIVRPIWPAKLIHCVRSMIADNAQAAESRNVVSPMQYADIEMDLVTYQVRRQGRDIHLSPIEFKLLRHLLERPEQVVTRHELQVAAWRHNVHVGPRTVDVHVGRLRKALLFGSDKDLIRTVRSIGYALSTPRPGGDSSQHEM